MFFRHPSWSDVPSSDLRALRRAALNGGGSEAPALWLDLLDHIDEELARRAPRPNGRGP